MNTLWGCATLEGSVQAGKEQLDALIAQGEGRLGSNARAAAARAHISPYLSCSSPPLLAFFAPARTNPLTSHCPHCSRQRRLLFP